MVESCNGQMQEMPRLEVSDETGKRQRCHGDLSIRAQASVYNVN